ncbi:MAG: hypothetical protein AAGD25_39075 [Cyanobacteria bacterium P01_F01_bin.150]
MPYRIDIKELQSVYGTDNDGLKQKIVASCQSVFESLDRDFESEDGWANAKSIMLDILNGSLREIKGNSAKHWYILELLIQELGKLMNNGNWYPANIDPMYGYAEFRMFYLDDPSRINLDSPDDFPVVFTIQQKNFKSALKNIKESYADHAQVSEFESWINEARDNKQDIILYYY